MVDSPVTEVRVSEQAGATTAALPAYPAWAKYKKVSVRADVLLDAYNSQAGVGVRAVSTEFLVDMQADLLLRVTAMQPYAHSGTQFDINDDFVVTSYCVLDVCCGIATCERLGVRSR